MVRGVCSSRYFNELLKYNVDRKYVERVVQMPIDARFLQIENILRKGYNRQHKILTNPSFDDIVPLELSYRFIFNFIRSSIALDSNYRHLYVSPHIKTKRNLPSWSFLDPIDFHGFYKANSLLSNMEILSYITPDERVVLEDILLSIYDDLTLKMELKNKVVLMELFGYTINIYSLGSILEYRMLELDNRILNLPNVHSESYLNVNPKCTSTYKVYV